MSYFHRKLTISFPRRTKFFKAVSKFVIGARASSTRSFSICSISGGVPGSRGANDQVSIPLNNYCIAGANTQLTIKARALGVEHASPIVALGANGRTVTVDVVMADGSSGST